jgi:prevent-host-death family protein
MKTNTVTATEANRTFSRLLRAVMSGERVEITSHGRKVAALEPIQTEEDEEAARKRRLEALEKLKKRWATQERITVGPWTREELYERD